MFYSNIISAFLKYVGYPARQKPGMLAIMVVCLLSQGFTVLASTEPEHREKADGLLARSRKTSGRKRVRLVEKATALLRKDVEPLKKRLKAMPKDSEEYEKTLIQWLKLRREQADLMGLRRGRGVIARMRLSVATTSQRKELRQWTQEALEEISGISRDLRKRRRWADNDASRRVTLGPKLQQQDLELRWTAAFTRYWHARSLPDGPERKRQLDMVATEAETMSDEMASDGENTHLKLLRAECLREKRDYKEAIELLESLTVEGTGSGVGEDAFFQLAMAKIGFLEEKIERENGNASMEVRGALSAARDAVGEYTERLAGKKAGVFRAVRAMLLRERLCRSGMSLGGNYHRRAQERLDGAARRFFNRYFSSSARVTVAELFVRNWSEQERNQAPPAVKVFLALYRLRQVGEQLGGGEIGELSDAEQKTVRRDLRKAIRLTEAATREKGAGEPTIVPDSLWIRGRAREKLGMMGKAAGDYTQLSTEYPSCAFARDAAERRMKIGGRMLDRAVEDDGDVRARREQLVDAFDVLLDHWSEDRHADQWRLNRGWQCSRLAASAQKDETFQRWAARAVDSYTTIERGGHLGRMARFLELHQRYRLMRRMPKAGRDEVDDLIDRLRAFSVSLQENMGAKTILKETSEKKLQDWASRCALYALILRDAILDDSEAREQLHEFGSEWPGQPAVLEAYRYLFQTALTEERYGDVSDILRAIQEQGKVDLTRELTWRFLGQVQQVLREEGESRVDKDTKEGYAKWARWLHEHTAEESQLFEPAVKFYADALARSSDTSRVRRALKLYDEHGIGGDNDRQMGETAEVDVGARIGRSRCLKKLGRYGEAVKILTPLCSGLPRDSGVFWTVQIERAECIVKDDHEGARKQLLTLIRQLRELDEGLGRPNVRARFEKLQSELEENGG